MVRTYLCAFAIFLFWSGIEAQGQFTTVINVPPTVIGSNQTIGSDTQLNIFDGAHIGTTFEAGNFNGASTNVEVNVSGGTVHGIFTNSGSAINVFGGIVINIDANRGSDVNLMSGLMKGIRLNPGSVADFSGGTFDGIGRVGGLNFFDPVDPAIFNISGGIVSGTLLAGPYSIINISGGYVDSRFIAESYSEVNISGGSVVAALSTRPFSEVNFSGGTLGPVIGIEGTMNISGGIVSDRFLAALLSEINVFGTQFVLDGVDITDTLITGVPLTITNRDQKLTGLLRDGSPFDFDLNSTLINGEDFFHTSAKLKITLVPEPLSMVSMAVLLPLFGAVGTVFVRKR